MDLERADPVEGCTNGNSYDTYPDEFRGGVKIGVNWHGWIEYIDTDRNIVYEVLYEVHSDSIAELRRHSMLGDTVREHVARSVARWGQWWHVDFE